MYTFKDFDTGQIRRTRGKFSHWDGPTGPLNAYYAIFLNPRGVVAVPEYCLTAETERAIPACPGKPRYYLVMCNWGWQICRGRRFPEVVEIFETEGDVHLDKDTERAAQDRCDALNAADPEWSGK
jgi:hypothetical protein